MALQDQLLGDPTEIVTSATPVTTNAVQFNGRGQHETIYATPAGTIAALTMGFPAAAESRLGQELTLVSHQTVTALTVVSTGLTILGTAVTALVVDTPVAWRKVAASTWMRTA